MAISFFKDEEERKKYLEDLYKRQQESWKEEQTRLQESTKDINWINTSRLSPEISQINGASFQRPAESEFQKFLGEIYGGSATKIANNTWDEIKKRYDEEIYKASNQYQATQILQEQQKQENERKLQEFIQNSGIKAPTQNVQLPTAENSSANMEQFRMNQLNKEWQANNDAIKKDIETLKEKGQIRLATPEEIEAIKSGGEEINDEAMRKAREYANRAKAGDFSWKSELYLQPVKEGGTGILSGTGEAYYTAKSYVLDALGDTEGAKDANRRARTIHERGNQEKQLRKYLKQMLIAQGQEDAWNDIEEMVAGATENISNVLLSQLVGGALKGGGANGTSIMEAGGNIGTALMAINAGGQSFAQRAQRNNNENMRENFDASTVEGFMNYAWENATGGNILTRRVGKNAVGETVVKNAGWLDKYLFKGVQKLGIKNTKALTAINKAWGMLGEVVEEWGTDIGTMLGNKAILGEDEFKDWEEFLAREGETAKQTLFTTLIMNAFGMGSMKTKDIANQYGLQYGTVEQLQKGMEKYAKDNKMTLTEENVGKVFNEFLKKEGIDIDFNTLVKEYDKENKSENTQNTIPTEYENDNQRRYYESAKKYNIDLSNEGIQAIQQLGEKRGVQIEYNSDVFKNSKEDAKWDKNSRTIYINPTAKAQTVLQQVAIHEMFHDTMGSDAHSKLIDTVMATIRQNPSEYQSSRQSVINAYIDQLNEIEGTNYKTLTSDQLTKQQNRLVDEEMTAKYLSEKLGNREFVNSLVQSTDRTTIEKIIDWISNRLQQLKNKITSNYEAEYWRGIRENLIKAYNSKYQGNNTQVNNAIETGNDIANTQDTTIQNTEQTILPTAEQAQETKVPVKESKQSLEAKFKALTGDSIMKADTVLAGIELRNNSRQNGKLDGELETNPYSEQAMQIYNKYKDSRKSSKYLYHSTSKDNLKSILKNGLTIGNKQNQEGISSKNNIYLSATEQLAQSFAPQDNITLRINPRAKLENLSNDLLGGEGSYTITNNIPADMLQIKQDGKWVNLKDSKLAKVEQNIEQNTEQLSIDTEQQIPEETKSEEKTILPTKETAKKSDNTKIREMAEIFKEGKWYEEQLKKLTANKDMLQHNADLIAQYKQKLEDLNKELDERVKLDHEEFMKEPYKVTPSEKITDKNEIISYLNQIGAYEKLADKYKKDNRTIDELAENNGFINKPINEIRQDYQTISKKLLEERNYTEPKNRDFEQIAKDELLRDKIDFAMTYVAYKDGIIDLPEKTEAPKQETNKTEKQILPVKQNTEESAQNNTKTAEKTQTNKEKKEKILPTKTTTEKIDDFGEKIGGARKDLAQTRDYKKQSKPVIHEYTVISPEAYKEKMSKSLMYTRGTKQEIDGYGVMFKGNLLTDGFKTEQEAEQYILDFKETLKSNMAFVKEFKDREDNPEYLVYIRNPRNPKDSKYSGKSFSSKADAESYSIALSIYLKEHGKNLFRPQIQSVTRENPNSKNATKATGEEIINNYGFRGGEFGNWVKNNERQDFLNYAYNGLNDLAEALGITKESIGQNNQMAIAFGARGSGLTGAVAHFEPDAKVINMTRLKGAGSLAHEYGHSIDNYLARLNKYNENGLATNSVLNRGRLPAEVKEAYDNLENALRYSISKDQAEIDKKNAVYEKNRKETLEYYLGSYIDRVFDGKATQYKRVKGEYKSVPIEVTDEQVKQYKEIRQKLMDGKVEGDREYKQVTDRYGTRYKYVYPEEISKLQDLYKEVTGHKINDDTVSGIYSRSKPIKQITEIKSESAFYKSALELDREFGRSSAYYSRLDEMWARAFESYVSDKLDAKGIKDTYLVHSVHNDEYALFNPYPAGEERKNINKAFDNLISTMINAGYFESNKNTTAQENNAVYDRRKLVDGYEQATIEGFNTEPENNLSKSNWDTYKESKKQTKEYLKDKGQTIEIEKRRFSKDFIDNGYIDLNGKKIKNASEVADMAQIFRNPKYETFRIIYMKGDTVVGQEAITAKTPNMTPAFVENDSFTKGTLKIQRRMDRLNADGYYLIHNHPSGNAVASQADKQMTKALHNKVSGFLGHIIIDSGTYAYITQTKNGIRTYDNKQIKNYSPDSIDKMLSNEDWTNVKLKNFEAVTNFAYDLKNNPNYSSLILTDAQLRPRIVVDIPNKFFNMTDKQLEGYVRNLARENGSSNAFIATQDKKVFAQVNTKLNTIKDTVLFEMNEDGTMKATAQGWSHNGIFDDYTPTAFHSTETEENYDLKEGYTRLYRGYEQEFNPNYDNSKLDNVNNYESWTDSYDLAKEYGDNVYYIDVPTTEIKNSVIDEDSTSETYGDRNLIYKNDKSAGINGKTGNEYLLYKDHDNYQNIKYNKMQPTTDNEGRTLTKEQQDYFKDSKIRDENGKILPVYHSTSSEFNVYDKNKMGQNYGWLEFGDGFYFTPSLETAKDFGEIGLRTGKTNIKEQYLDIENPFNIYKSNDKETINKMALDIENEYNQENNSNLKISDFKKENGGRFIDFLKNGLNYSDKEIQNILKKYGYDGINAIENKNGEYKGQVVAFEPNQIKNVDNTNPTDNEDIRYNRETKAYDNYLKKHVVNEGTVDTLEDVLPTKEKQETKLPTKKTTKNIKKPLEKQIKEEAGTKVPFRQLTKNEQIFTNAKQFLNQDIVRDITTNDIKNISESELKKGMKQLYQSQLDSNFSTVNYKDDTTRQRTYRAYKNDKNLKYDNSIVNNALDTVKANRNDNRTVKQWLDVAKQIGINSENLSAKQIQDIAFGSWFNLQPTKHITRYDNINKVNLPFTPINSDKWINTIYDTVKQIKMQQFEKTLDTKVEPVAEVVKRKGTETQETVQPIPKANEEVLLPTNETTEKVATSEDVDYSELDLPKMKEKFRKFYQSIIDNPNTSEEAKAVARELIGLDTYVPDSNKRQLKRADFAIQQMGLEGSLEGLKYKLFHNERISATDIAIGNRLIQFASRIGNRTLLQDAIETTAIMGTQTGQALQALAILARQSPEGQVTSIQRAVDKMNADLQLKYARKGKVAPQFDFTAEMQQRILDAGDNVDLLYKTVDDIYNELGQQVPKSLSEQLDEWRYFSMLANAKTHARNIFGNVGMHAMQRAKDRLAGGIEDIASHFIPMNERMHTLRIPSEKTKQFARNDLLNREVQTMLGMNEDKYNPQSRLQGSRRIFKNDLMEKYVGGAFRADSKALSTEDNWGLSAMYPKAMAEYLTANRIDVDNMTDTQLAKARNYAVRQAQNATFHQASGLASAMTQLSNKNVIAKFFLDAVVPFKKTPINVLKTGIEYSPIGLVKSMTYDIAQVSNGNMNASQYIDNLAKGLTGSGLMFVGYVLASLGVIKASGPDDKKKETFEEETGEQDYSLQIGNASVKLDWLSPVGMPFFTGAELYEQFNEAKKEKAKGGNESDLDIAVRNTGKILNSLSSTANPISEMSMMQGITNVLASYNREQALGDMITNSFKSYVGQYVPTSLGQLARTTDEYERSTKSTKTGTFERAFDQTFNQIKSKIPIARQTLPVKTDIWGNEVKQSDNIGERALNNFLNPATIKEITSDDKVNKELNNVYDMTKESSVLPTTLDKSFKINGIDYYYNNEEYAKYSKQYGQTAHKLLDNLVSSSEYKKLDNTQKVKAISEIYSYAKEKSKVDYAKDNKIDGVKPSTDYTALNEFTDDAKSAYLTYKAKTSGLTKTNEKLQVLLDSNYTDSQKRRIYEYTEGKKDIVFQFANEMKADEYLKYKIANIQGEKDEYGQTKTGTKKKAELNYINNNISGYFNRLILMAQSYKLSRAQQRDLANYINQANPEEALEIFKKLSNNFKVDSEGRVYYK